MILCRAPYRISLGGGGTDLPSYYREHEGFLLSAAIDKYVIVTVTRPFTEGVYLKYSHLEHVDKIAQVLATLGIRAFAHAIGVNRLTLRRGDQFLILTIGNAVPIRIAAHTV